MTVAFSKVNSFVEALAEKVHKLDTDTLQLALTDAAHAPSATTTKLSDLTQISYTNLSSQVLTVTGSSQSSGTYKLTIADLVLTASGAVGPFQYVVLFNQTASNDEVIGYYNYGSEVTMASTDTFTINFDDANGVLTLA